MINVAKAIAELEAMDQDEVLVPKAQYAELLSEVALGNVARLRLTNVRSIVNAGAGAAGLLT